MSLWIGDQGVDARRAQVSGWVSHQGQGQQPSRRLHLRVTVEILKQGT